MAQQLKALVALTEGLGLVPGIDMVAHGNSNSRGSDNFFRPLHMVFIPKCRQNTHTYKIK